MASNIIALLITVAQYTHNSPALVLAIAEAESAGNISAVSYKEAKGLMQLTKAALVDIEHNARMLPKICRRVKSSDDMFDAKKNALAGACYLKLLEFYVEGENNVIRAYNAGPTRVTRWLNRLTTLPIETVKYHKRVKSLIEKYRRYDE